MYLRRYLENRRGVIHLLVLLSLVFLFGGSLQAWAQPSPWKGREVFESRGCNQCHSVYGTGWKRGPDLGKRQFYGTRLELAAALWNHFPGMADAMRSTGFEFRKISEQQMTELISYLSFIRYLGFPGNEWKGRRLLKSKNCVSCHTFGGEGNKMGPDISAMQEYMSALRLAESMWNHGPALMEAFQQRGVRFPEFRNNEFVHLSAGIRSFMSPKSVPPDAFNLGNPVVGRKLIEAKGCLQCHAVRGEGESIGPDFSTVKSGYSVTQIAGRLWNHGPVMWKEIQRRGLPFPRFARGEMADVIAYLYSLGLEDEPGSREKGEELVKTRSCLSCHSLRGTGGNVSMDLAKLEDIDTQDAMISAMWNHAPAMREALRARRMTWPELNGQDMANLHAFLRSINRLTSSHEPQPIPPVRKGMK